MVLAAMPSRSCTPALFSPWQACATACTGGRCGPSGQGRFLQESSYPSYALPAFAAAPDALGSAFAEGAAGAPAVDPEGILPLSPLVLNPEPLTAPTQLNPKKGAGLYFFLGANEALQSARLSWTYNWWHTLSFVSLPDTRSESSWTQSACSA